VWGWAPLAIGLLVYMEGAVTPPVPAGAFEQVLNAPASEGIGAGVCALFGENGVPPLGVAGGAGGGLVRLSVVAGVGATHCLPPPL